MKKKLLSLLIITTLSIGITACGKSTESSSDKTVAELEAQIEDLQKQLEEAKQGNSTDGLDGTESSYDSETQDIIKYTEENAEYQGVCGADAKWYYKDNVLVIKGTGDIIDNPWYEFYYKSDPKLEKDINWVIIDEGITSICDSAFSGGDGSNFKNLSKVILPQTLESIGNSAFDSCFNLKSIEIPNSVTYIGRQAFWYTSLESINIPNSLNELGDYAFTKCPLSDEATIEKIKSINPNAIVTP